jgi:hypothetical protein
VLVEIGPEGGRRHNSPLIFPLPFEGRRPEAPPWKRAKKLWSCYNLRSPTDTTLPLFLTLLLLLSQNKKGNKETLSKPKAERLVGAFGALFSLLCPFHYKGFTIYRRPLGMIIYLNYTFSVPDK